MGSTRVEVELDVCVFFPLIGVIVRSPFHSGMSLSSSSIHRRECIGLHLYIAQLYAGRRALRRYKHGESNEDSSAECDSSKVSENVLNSNQR